MKKKNNEGVYVVPAFSGIGAPYWRPDARGLISGLTRDSDWKNIVRAVIESVAYQSYDLFYSMKKDGLKPKTIKVDGGMVANNWFSQFLSDITNLKVLRPKVLETTATGRVIIFTRTKHRAKRVAADLTDRNYKVTALQGNLSQNKRNMAINGFKTGKYDILVATDIASRGIDVSKVSHVINFDIPNTVDAYIHRIGRTGRAESRGEALTFIVRDDESMVRSLGENVVAAASNTALARLRKAMHAFFAQPLEGGLNVATVKFGKRQFFGLRGATQSPHRPPPRSLSRPPFPAPLSPAWLPLSAPPRAPARSCSLTR
mgnify:CR=1 FL=1